MLPVLVLVLLAVLFPLTAIGKEAWSVIVYIQNNGSAVDNQIFYDLSQEGRDDAIKKSQAVCETRAKKQRPGKYRCEEKR